MEKKKITLKLGISISCQLMNLQKNHGTVSNSNDLNVQSNIFINKNMF